MALRKKTRDEDDEMKNAALEMALGNVQQSLAGIKSGSEWPRKSLTYHC